MRATFLMVMLAAGTLACSRDSATVAPASDKPAARPPADVTAAPAPGSGVTGVVVETMDSGGYTYLRLDTAAGDVWAAVKQTTVAKGQTVSVVNAMVMDGFESRTLKRTFDHILFGELSGAAGSVAAGDPPPTPQDQTAMETMAAQHMAGSAEVGDLKVAKAEGPDARTIAEVFGQRDRLKDRPVVVRAKVVKFLAGIMGRNWLHVRDGSGARGEDDLTVTTQDTLAVGDVVTVKGVVHLDRDFGAGYRYPVIVEDASVTK